MKLLFGSPVFNDGLNVTVRKGVKWATVSGEVDIVETGREMVVLGKGEVVDVKVMPFDSIYDSMIRDEHDPSCRTWHGLYKGMLTAYPNFIPEELVTIIYFNFKKHENSN